MQSPRIQLTPPPDITGRLMQHGYRKPLSGSETDVSTSNESLTIEERKILQHGVRVPPQGEENHAVEIDPVHTYVIHDPVSGVPQFFSQSISRPIEYENPKYANLYPESIHHIMPLSTQMPSNIPMYHNIQKQMDLSPNNNFSPNNNYSQSPIYSNLPFQELQRVAEIPKDYLDQSEVLKYLAKELNHPNVMAEISNRNQDQRQAVDQPQVILSNVRRHGLDGVKSRSAEKLSVVSRSQPDLCHVQHFSEDIGAKLLPTALRPEIRSPSVRTPNIQLDYMVELLSAENTALRSELDLYSKKVSKLQKFEMELQNVQKAYEDLTLSCDKRERLEISIRSKLESEIRRLQEHINEMQGFDSNSPQLSPRINTSPLFSDKGDSGLRGELSKREVLIAQLLTQTKELMAEKERQEIELQAQRATLQEQRNHIDILDSALTNAQSNVMRLEEENQKKQIYVERVAQLQKALTNLQQTSEKRLQVERKLRVQHEKEIQALKMLQREGRLGSVSRTESSENLELMRNTIMEYEEKIIGLEAEVSKWEQRYIEESTMRQIAVDAASVPKDAKIAALERTSLESEKLIAQARSEKLKHMDELYAANRRCTELESRIKDFESKLAEKDAMIKVLQQRSQEKDAVLQNAVLGRPPRHTRAASTLGLTTSSSSHPATTNSGISSLGRTSPSNMLHRRTGSASGSLLSISSDSSSTGQPTSHSSPVDNSATGKKSIDEQLKELDTRLSRLHHKRSASRERKISKSLLESMKEMLCSQK